MTDSTRTGLALATASALAIAGFTALGSIFEYPQVLENLPTTSSRSIANTRSR